VKLREREREREREIWLTDAVSLPSAGALPKPFLLVQCAVLYLFTYRYLSIYAYVYI